MFFQKKDTTKNPAVAFDEAIAAAIDEARRANVSGLYTSRVLEDAARNEAMRHAVTAPLR